jgi:asparagine synthase (glutamine-hydrolysing)
LRHQPIPVASRVQNSYQEFTARAEYAYDYGMPQWLARLDRTVSPLRLERLFLGRHKFCHFRIWYRDQLAESLKEMLLDGRSRGRAWLNGGRMEAMVKGHTEGRANFTSEIHRILALELIQRELIEKN